MKTIHILILTILGLCLPAFVLAQVPGIINYQGRVTVGGTNFDGTGQFKFALVNSGASQTYWSNGNNAVSLTVTKGLYSVLLGDTTIGNMAISIPMSVFTNTDVRLRVWFNDGVSGLQQLAPDQRLAAVGYAMIAATVPNGAITSAQLASNAVAASNLAAGAVTAAAIANGAVGVNQLASNSVNSLIQSNLTTMGVLTTNTPQYWASNQYYLACAYLSTNATAGPWYGGVDLVTLVLAESADGINFSLLSGIDPSRDSGGASAVNEPNIWTANGRLFYTWQLGGAEAPTNVIPIATSPGFSLPPTQIAGIDCSSIGCTVGVGGVTLGFIGAGKMDATPGAIASNLFQAISTNGIAGTKVYVTTCTNVPQYTGWTTPKRIPILNGSHDLTNYCILPVGFTYHSTNMLLYTYVSITNNNYTYLALATNTTAQDQSYSIWKFGDFGGWATNPGCFSINGTYLPGQVQMRGRPSPVFLSDRIRLYFEIGFTNLYLQGMRGDPEAKLCYSDSFDDWKTWTPLQYCPLTTSNYFLREVTVLPVPAASDLQNTIGTRLGVYSPTNSTTGASVAGGLTADTATITGLTVSNTLTFGRLAHAPWLTTNALNVLTGITNFTVFADTTANAVSNVFGSSTITGVMLFFSNIGTSTNGFTIDFGSTSTLTNNGSRYLSLAPMQHILVQKISTRAWASLGDNVFAGMIVTNAPAVTQTNSTWGLVIGSDGKQYRVPLYK